MSKKLQLLVLTLLMSIYPLKASIIYTDIVDDALAPGGGDIIQVQFQNQNNTAIFYFDDASSWYGGDPNILTPYFWPQGSTGYEVISVPGQILSLSYGSLINAQSSFNSISPSKFITTTNQPAFSSGINYIGVSFTFGNNLHYGWIRVDWDPAGAGQFIVLDYAYNDTPNGTIFAGEMPTVLVNSISLTGQNGLSSVTTSGGSLAINASVLPINADDMTYNWSVVNGSGSASINSNGLLTAITDGIVTVIATANDASGTTGYIEISISNQSVSIGEENSEFVFNIFPNPTNSIININTNQHKVTEINIIDINGRFIKPLNPTNKSFDVSDLISGIYTIQIHTEDKIVYRKFIKK